MSLKVIEMVLFQSFGTASYLYSIITMGLCCIISEMRWDIGQRITIFHSPPPCILRSIRGVPIGILL